MKKLLFVILSILISSVSVESQTYNLYLPIVMNGSYSNAGYAWPNIGATENSLLKVGWRQDWRITPGLLKNGNVEYVQHFSCDVRPYWTYNEDVTAHMFDLLRSHVEIIGVDTPFYLLFLNEPQHPGQCSRTPEQSAYMYREVLKIAPNAIIVGPQVSDWDYPNWTWLREWYRQIDLLGLPHPEYAGIHSYRSDDPALLVNSQFSALAELGGTQKGWVTEFGNPNPEVIRQMILYYQSDPRIERYAYFTPHGLVDGTWDNLALFIDGELTETGQVWVELHP